MPCLNIEGEKLKKKWTNLGEFIMDNVFKILILSIRKISSGLMRVKVSE